MPLRIAIIAAVVIAFLVLCTARVTLPALFLVGLFAWAILASVTAFALWWRGRPHSPRSTPL